jgi:hypothetical protein
MSGYLSSRLVIVAAGVAALVSSLLATPAGAALLAYDPFTVGVGPADYRAGDEVAGTDLLGGQNPATVPTPFYAGGWIEPSGSNSQAVKNIGSLAYPMFPQAGGQIRETIQFDCCTFGRTGRPIAGGLGGGREARTIYQSFLIDFGSQGTDDPSQHGYRAYEMWNGAVNDANLAVNLVLSHFAGVNELTLRVTTASGTQTALVGGGLTLPELAGTHLIVFRFDFDPAAPDTVSVYLDPTDSIEANYTPAATASAPNSDLFITHHGAFTHFTFSGAGHVPGAFDELRWGDTFADVTPFLTEVPVPAPAPLGLLAFGVLAMAGLRKRRHRIGRQESCGDARMTTAWT